MKRLACVAVIVVWGFSPAAAHAQACSSASKVTSDIWDEVDQFVKAYPCSSPVDCSIKQGALLTDKLIKFWNRMASGGWGRIGPRRLEFNRNLTGTLVGTGGRMFVSFPAPATPVTITIDETGGEGRASVVVCKVDEKNGRTTVDTKWFNDTNERQRKSDEHRSVEVRGVRGDVITVHLDGKSVTRSFSYRIRASH